MADPTAADILSNSQNPKSVVHDGTRVEQFSVKDQIDAMKFKAANAGVAKSHRGIRISRLVPPGGTGERYSGDPTT